MATQISQDDMQSFYEFLGRRLQGGGAGDLTPEQSVREFRAYQTELARFKEETQPALEQSARGESKPLDLDALMKRVRARLADDGIAD
jgi:hypothetical protein